MSRLVVDDPERVAKWVCERAGGLYAIGDYAIGVEDNGVLVAGVFYNIYFGPSIAMHMAVEPGNWLTRERLWVVFHYPFEYLGVKKIIGYVQEDNKTSRRLVEHLGFTLETKVKDACKGGDLLVYTMVKDQCRFLGFRRKL